MVVAILAILGALGVGFSVGYRQNLRQIEYDKNAEILFEAAQRSMVDIVAFDDKNYDRLTKHDDSGDPITAGVGKLSNESGVSPTSTEDDDLLYGKTYFLLVPPKTETIEGDSRLSEAAKALVEGQVDDEIIDRGWIIEYTPKSLQVKSVFYFDGNAPSEFYDSGKGAVGDIDIPTFRTLPKNERLKLSRVNKYTIGYFEGETSDEENIEESLIVAVQKPENGEVLRETVSVLTDKELKTGDDGDQVILDIFIRGDQSDAEIHYTIDVPRIVFYKNTTGNLNGMYEADFSFYLDSLDTPFRSTYGNLTGDMSYFSNMNFFETSAVVWDSHSVTSLEVKKDSDGRNINFIPGENVTVSAAADKNYTIKAEHPGRTFNSLFAKGLTTFDGTLYPVEISCGRHLQNLDAALSGVDAKKVWAGRDDSISGLSVIQTGNIDWTYYTGKSFTPITNTQIDKFLVYKNDSNEDGIGDTYYTISDLLISGGGFDGSAVSDASLVSGAAVLSDMSGYAGLFSAYYGQSITGLQLVGENISASGLTAAGGIAGALIPSVSFSAVDCHVYMSENDFAGKTLNEVKGTWLSGVSGTAPDVKCGAGGLFGIVPTHEVADSEGDMSSVTPDITIRTSSASTVVDAAKDGSSKTYAGGLVGYADGTVTIDKSYADCYITADVVGGLCGRVGSSSAIAGSYSAGFVYDFSGIDEVAGLIPSDIGSATDTYSLFQLGGEDDYGSDTLKNLNVSYTVKSGSTDRLYFFTDMLNDAASQAKVGEEVDVELLQSGLNEDDKPYFSDGTFIYPKTLSKNTRPKSYPYGLTDVMASITQYLNPMIVLDPVSGDAMQHYGDWLEMSKKHTVNFYYSTEASGKIAQTSTSANAALSLPTNATKYPSGTTPLYYYFAEDKGVSSLGSYRGAQQIVQHDTNVYIPQQNFSVEGRERMILYWEYTYKGQKYWYVPSDEDLDFDNYYNEGTHYFGVIYYCDDESGNALSNPFVKGARIYAKYNKTKDKYYKYVDNAETDVEIKNPFEYVRTDMDAYAHFYQSDALKYIRLYYVIYPDSSRDSNPSEGKVVKRYLGRKRVTAQEAGFDSDGKVIYNYFINTQAHNNLGGYYFQGWYGDAIGSAASRQSMIAADDSQLVALSSSVVASGNLYAIYEVLNRYTIKTEFCLAGSDGDLWGVAIASPSVDTYTKNDLTLNDDGNFSGTKSIYLRDLASDGTDGGYKLVNSYARFFPEGSTEPTDTKYSIKKDTSGNEYIEEDISENMAGGTYVVTYQSTETIKYVVHQVYQDTELNAALSEFPYAENQIKKLTEDKTGSGRVGESVSSNSLEPLGGDGFEIASYKDSPIISDKLSTSGNYKDYYECTVNYKRKKIKLYYDLNGGTYTTGTSDTKYGYREFDEVTYGAPINTAGFLSSVTDENMKKTGMKFKEFKIYDYAAYQSGDTSKSYEKTSGMGEGNSAKAMIAVAVWELDPNISVKLEIYRQDRTNDLGLDASEKTYLLQKQGYITSSIGEITETTTDAKKEAVRKKKNELLSATSQAALQELLVGTYRNSKWSGGYLSTTDEMYSQITSDEVMHYFSAADASLWNSYKPEIVDGELVIRLYYDRQTVTVRMDYGNYFYDYLNSYSITADQVNAASDDINSASGYEEKGDYIDVETYDGFYYRDGSDYKYSYRYRIIMKALYGADLDESKYVWTKEIQWKINNSSTNKTRITSFTDEDGSFYSNNKGTTWNFKYNGYYSGNRSSNLYLRNLDNTTTTLVDSIQMASGTRFTIVPGRYYGFELETANNVAHHDGEEFTIDTNYNFVFKRKVHDISYSGILNASTYTKENIKFGTPLTSAENLSTYFPVTGLKHPTNDGKYTFGGWYATSKYEDSALIVDAKGKVSDKYKNLTMDDRDMQFFARWIPKKYKVTYNPLYPGGEEFDKDDPNYQHQIGFETSVSENTSDPVNGKLLELSTSLNSRIKVESDGTVTYTIPKTSEDELDTVYRFDGWWHATYNSSTEEYTYTTQFTDSEPVYGTVNVYARWTQIEGYTDLHFKCVRVVTDSAGNVSTTEYTKVPTIRVPMGKATYVYAPLVDSTWDNEAAWSGFYPTVTRVKQTFKTEDPEITFYYSKGDAMSFYIFNYVEVDPYKGTTGTPLKELFSVENITSATTTYSVIPEGHPGFILDGDDSSIRVTSSYLSSLNPQNIIKFTYKPDVDSIELEVSDGLYGDDESIPVITYDGKILGFAIDSAVFNLVDESGTPISGYDFKSMYRIYNRKSTKIYVNGVWKKVSEVGDNEGWVDEDSFHADYLNDESAMMLSGGVYRAEAKLVLQKNDEDYLTVWKSDGKVAFRIADLADDE